jgi:hypothetical protein
MMRMPWLGFYGPSASAVRGNRLATGGAAAVASAVRRESRRFTGFLVVH